MSFSANSIIIDRNHNSTCKVNHLLLSWENNAIFL